MPKEKTVVVAIQKWLHSLPVPVRVRKLADRFTSGYPDLQAFFCWYGSLIVLEVEVKHPGGSGKVSALQAAEADEMRRVTEKANYGRYVHVVAESVGDVKEALERAGVTFG